jgi:drug/metabolite transporter (DMT)-like permease
MRAKRALRSLALSQGRLRGFARRAQILQRQKLALQDDNRSALPSKPPVNFRKYLVLAGVTVFAAAGDSMLSHGMKQVGSISVNHVQGVIFAVLNPWVAVGILLLLAFFATYMTALSWADLTYVLPATSLGYVILALVARFVLHEHVSPLRWLGIVLITGGVGFVAGGPELTKHLHLEHVEDEARVTAPASGIER